MPICAASASIEFGLKWRHLRPDRALETLDVEQPAVKDRIRHALRPGKMDVASQRLPGLVHQATSLVKEAVAVLIDHDAVGIDQHDRRGILAARIDRLDMHAVPIAGNGGALLGRHAEAVAGVEARSRRDQLDALAAGPEMRAHHRRIALKSAAGENDGIGSERCRRTIAGMNLDAFDAMLPRQHQPGRLAFIADFHACALPRGEQFCNDGAAAADRLNARRPGAEIIKRRDEFDAVALQPSDGCGCIVRQGAKIAGIAAPAAGPEHVVGETRIDPVRRIEPHVRR